MDHQLTRVHFKGNRPDRDVYLEEVKDSGAAIYSRAIAQHVQERLESLGNFSRLDTGRARWGGNTISTTSLRSTPWTCPVRTSTADSTSTTYATTSASSPNPPRRIC